MNKQEILEYINYKGKYTKEVKTKINKLLKKYHPDTNKDDKKTILIIYEVKKELESGKKIDYNNKQKQEEKTNHQEEKPKQHEDTINTFFIERIIKILKQRKRFIQKELNNLYKKSYYYTNKIYNESYDKGLIDIKIDELNNNIKYIKKVDNIEIMLLIIIILVIALSIIFKKYYLLFFIIIPIYSEKCYLNSKKNYINDTMKLIEKLKVQKKEFIDREEEYNKNIKEIRTHEIKLEKEIKTINNDISFYNNELSKSYSKEKVAENSKDNIRYQKTK